MKEQLNKMLLAAGYTVVMIHIEEGNGTSRLTVEASKPKEDRRRRKAPVPEPAEPKATA